VFAFGEHAVRLLIMLMLVIGARAGSVILRRRISPSAGKRPGIGRRYYRPFSRR